MGKSRWIVGLTSTIAVYHFLAVAQIHTFLGLFVPANVHLAVSISSAMTLVFLLLPASGERHGEDTEAAVGLRHVPWYDRLLMASGLTGAGFVVFFHEAVLDYGEYGFLDTKGVILATMLAIPVLEAVRRTVGWALPIIILFFVSITVFQEYLPGLLYGRGFAVSNLLYSAYMGDAGIFGLPLGIAANIVIVFLVFGAMMERAGASRWFMDMALALTGWSRGGPAKAAVVASAMFGSISGSPSGNCATTGVFTIPMMKKIGYPPAFAAGVEAVASTRGIILPPVRGAIACIMGQRSDTTNNAVVIAAAVPASLYFLIVFVSVHLQARKDGIEALPRADIPAFWPAFVRGWYFLLPIGVLIYFLVIKNFPPGIAGIYTCIAVFFVSFLAGRENWLTPKRLIMAFDEGVRRWITVASITAAVGIMIGALELSGVGIKVSRFIVDLAGGDLTLTLILIGLVSLIVGMGLDATPAYITLATLMAPALIQLGVPPIAAHLFVVYWGLASFYTPPTCIAVFVTASIAGSKVWETGWESVRLGIAAFLIPFAFVYNTGLLLDGTLDKILIGVLTAVVGSVLLAGGIRGYMFGLLNVVQRLVLFGGGLLLIAPGVTLPLAGLGASALMLAPKLKQLRISRL